MAFDLRNVQKRDHGTWSRGRVRRQAHAKKSRLRRDGTSPCGPFTRESAFREGYQLAACDSTSDRVFSARMRDNLSCTKHRDTRHRRYVDKSTHSGSGGDVHARRRRLAANPSIMASTTRPTMPAAGTATVG